MVWLQTNRKKYYYSENICGQQYRDIINFALKQGCTFFEICIRHDIDFKGDSTYSYDKKAYNLISDLNTFLITKSKSNSWATSMVIEREKVVEVYRFKFNSDSQAVLLNYSQSIRDWQGPNLPEDITFFQEEKLWLGVVGHEQMSWWFLTDEEYQEIINMSISLFGGE